MPLLLSRCYRASWHVRFGRHLASFATTTNQTHSILCHYLDIGLVQFPFGTGCVLVVLGCLNLGTGDIGYAVGGTSIAWGIITIGLHFWLKGKNAAVHVQLLR